MLRKLVAVVLLLQVFKGTEQMKDAEDTKCKGHDINIDDEDMMVILDCAADMQIMSKADLTPEKMPCFGKCIVEKRGFLDADGKPHKEKILAKVDQTVPAALKDEVMKFLTACLDEHAGKVQPNDKTCKTYEPLTDCIHKAFLHICKEG